jgi:hypothetical protein
MSEQQQQQQNDSDCDKDLISKLKKQLDDLGTKAFIIETTKQDELDDVKFKSKQEIDSLNHIISRTFNYIINLISISTLNNNCFLFLLLL